jgi:hypothetical protein
MRRTRIRVTRAGIVDLAVGIAVAVAGCGEPLLSNSAYQTPLLTFQPFFTEPYDAAGLAKIRVGVVWIDPFELRDDLPQTPPTITDRRSDKQYTVDLFAPPPAAAIRHLPDATGGVAASFAFGEIVAFDDEDGDGRFAVTSRAEGSSMVAPDAYAGSVEARVLLYVETPARVGGPIDAAWHALFDPPGYHLASFACAGTPTVRTLPPGSRSFPMTLAAETSPHLIFTRTCVTPLPTGAP